MSFRFLDLPPELRNAVYEYIYQPELFRHDVDEGFPSYNFDLRLFRVNKQISHEAQRVSWKNFVFVRVDTPWDEAQTHIQEKGHIPIVVSGYQAEEFHGYKLRVSIDADSVAGLDRDSRKFVILLQDLATFTEMWRYSELSSGAELNAHLRLTLELRDIYDQEDVELPISLQRKLLEPFSLIKGLRDVQVTGPHSMALQDSLKAAMSIPETSQEKCLEESTRLKDIGNVALRNGDPLAALHYYIDSFKAMHIVCQGRYRAVWADAWFNKILVGGPFDGQHGQMIRIMLRIKLVANIVKAYLDLHDFEEAYFWGNRTLTIMRQAIGSEEIIPLHNFPSAPELGKICYRTGMACKAVGKTGEAKKLFEAAHIYLPRDELVTRELDNKPLLIG